MDLVERYCANCGAAYVVGDAVCGACGASLKVTRQLDDTKSLPPPPSLRLAVHLQTLQLFNERYRIVRQVGVGGFGAVYEAADTWEPRHVAIKEISLGGLSAQQVIEATGSFNREVQMLSSLRHAGIPRMYEQSTDAGHWYLVMEFIAGQTLENVQGQADGGRLPLERVLSIGLQICSVLEYLHSQRPAVIFRDIKPANIMLTPKGNLYLIDFGVARRYQPGRTRDTIAFGSPGYAAPEQYGRAQTTPLADIYSLGALLYSLLTGDDPSEHPFQFPPLRFYGVDGIRELDALIQRMVASNSAQRPQRVRAELQRIQQIHYQSRRRAPLWIPPKGRTPPALVALSAGGQPQQKNNVSGPATPVPQSQQKNNVSGPATPIPQSQTPSPALATTGAGQQTSTFQSQIASVPAAVASAGSQQQKMSAPSTSGSQPPARKTSRRRILVGGLIAGGAFLSFGLFAAWESNQNRAVATIPITESTPIAVDTPTPTAQSAEVTPSSSSGFPAVPDNGTTYWSTDMNYAVVFANDQQLEIYSAKQQRLLHTIPGSDAFYLASPLIAWSPDNSQFFFYNNTANGFVWNIQQEKQSYALPQVSGSVAWSPDSQYLAVSGATASGITLFLLRATDGSQIFQQSFTDADALSYIAWSPDSRYLVFPTTKSNSWLAGTPWSMEIWDSQSGQKVSKIGGTLPISQSGAFYYAASGLAWSPDGTMIAVGMDNDIWLISLAYDQGAPRQARTSILHAAATNSSSGFASNTLTWAPNSRYLAISQNEVYGGLNIYSVASSKNILSATNSSGSAFVALRWAADSKSITTADDSNVLSTWKVG